MTLPAAYFDAVYDGSRDPWSFESRWYEQRKYELTVASLPRARYRKGFEIGCSIGVLTAMLARRCDTLLAVDIADSAVKATQQRLEGRPGVAVEQLDVAAGWPEGSFDLIVLSEVGYYFSASDLRALIAHATVSLDRDGAVIAVHWLHEVSDYPQRGKDVHEALADSPGLERLVCHEEADFLLEVFVPSPAASVARTTGLLS
jgi:SAM-dependent methyltransferase